MTKYKFENFG